MISKKLYTLEEALSVEKNKASHFYMYLTEIDRLNFK